MALDKDGEVVLETTERDMAKRDFSDANYNTMYKTTQTAYLDSKRNSVDTDTQKGHQTINIKQKQPKAQKGQVISSVNFDLVIENEMLPRQKIINHASAERSIIHDLIGYNHKHRNDPRKENPTTSLPHLPQVQAADSSDNSYIPKSKSQMSYQTVTKSNFKTKIRTKPKQQLKPQSEPQLLARQRDGDEQQGIAPDDDKDNGQHF